MAKRATNSLEGVEGLSVRVNRVAAPVREQVLEQLRQAIVEMRLKPEQRLVERELIEQTGVSRTTIREVLRQLAAEGLVTTIPHKGTVVASPSIESAAELYEVRAVLEGMAARQFAERATDLNMRALRRAFEGIEKRARSGEASSQAMLEAKKRFYDALFDGAGQRHDPRHRREPPGAGHGAAGGLDEPARPQREDRGGGARDRRGARGPRRRSGRRGLRAPRQRGGAHGLRGDGRGRGRLGAGGGASSSSTAWASRKDSRPAGAPQ